MVVVFDFVFVDQSLCLMIKICVCIFVCVCLDQRLRHLYPMCMGKGRQVSVGDVDGVYLCLSLCLSLYLCLLIKACVFICVCVCLGQRPRHLYPMRMSKGRQVSVGDVDGVCV